jgi:hypothetical protein
MYDFRRRKRSIFFNYDSEINGFIKSAVEKQAFVLIMAAGNATL